MKVHSQIICFSLVLLLVSACAPAATPAEEAATTEPESTSTTEKYHSRDTRTGIAEIDTVLEAVGSNDPQKLRDAIHYSTLACKTVNALGGPPPCHEGEAEGTLVEALPILGSEGGHLRKEDIKDSFVLDVTSLYAVYRVSEKVFSDANYPKGDYGVILVGADNSSTVVLQIKEGGIVRIDFVMNDSPDALRNILERDASEVILAPKSWPCFYGTKRIHRVVLEPSGFNLVLDAPFSSRYNLPASIVNYVRAEQYSAPTHVIKENVSCPHIQSASTRRAAAICAAHTMLCSPAT